MHMEMVTLRVHMVLKACMHLVSPNSNVPPPIITSAGRLTFFLFNFCIVFKLLDMTEQVFS